MVLKRMPCHILPIIKIGTLSHSPFAWEKTPTCVSWIPFDAIQRMHREGSHGSMVPMETLCKSVQQGVSLHVVKQGDLQVGLVRSAHLAPPSLVSGELVLVSRKLTRRLLLPGDVLIPRVGGGGRADYVGNEASPLLPTQELMAIRLKNPRHAPLIAAALSSEPVRRQMQGVAAGSTIPTLTRNAILQLQVPDPETRKARTLLEMLTHVRESVVRGELELAGIRAEVDRFLENVPAQVTRDGWRWVKPHALPPDWGWQNTVHQFVLKEAQRCLHRTLPLDRLPGLNIQRGGDLKALSGLKRLNPGGFRANWYLALADSIEMEPEFGSKPGVLLDGKALLLPMVGGIEGAPIYIGGDLIKQVGGTVVAPSHWGVLTHFAWLRSLAVVLDHPFIRLQRRLAGVSSTVSHVPMELLKELLLPAVPENQWRHWEMSLESIHDQLFAAAGVYRKAINEIEELTDDTIG